MSVIGETRVRGRAGDFYECLILKKGDVPFRALIGVFVEANINPCVDLLIAHVERNYQHRVKLTKVWLGHGSMTLITPDGRKERRTFEAPLSDADDKVWAHLVYEVV